MAIVVRRYILTAAADADIAKINDRIPGTGAITGNAGGKVVDYQFDDAVASADDVDEFWEDVGYTFDAQNPSTSITVRFAELNSLLHLSGGTMTGPLNLGGSPINNVADPTLPGDVSTKQYVDSVVAGIRDPKDGVRLLEARDLVGAESWVAAGSGVGKTLTAPTDLVTNNNFDSVTAVIGDRILLTGSGAHNGIYAVTQLADGFSQPTVLTRASDCDEDAEVTQGTRTSVAEGATYARQAWQLTTPDPILVDTTSQTWAFQNSADTVSGGAGLARSVNVLSVDLDDTADAQTAGSGGGSSGLEFDVSGAAGQLRVKVDPAGGVQRGANGLQLELSATGAVAVGATGLGVQVDGSTIQVNASNQLEVVGGGSSTTDYSFGAGRVGSTTTPRYLVPGGGDKLAPTSVGVFGIRATRGGTLSKLKIFHGVPAGNGNDITYTVRIAGVPSAVVAVVASTSANGDSGVLTAAVTEGSLLEIEVTKAASVGASPRRVSATFDIT